MVDEDAGPPSIEEIREEIDRCVDLIHQGSPVSAVTRLTQLGWRLEGLDSLEAPVPTVKAPKRKPLYAWEHEETINRCSTEYAPWYVIPADHKWYRNLVIARIIKDTLENMKLRFPESKEDLSNVVIPD